MRRFATPVLGVPAALVVLSLAGFGLGEGGIVAGILGVALGAALRLADGTGQGGDGGSFATACDGGD